MPGAAADRMTGEVLERLGRERPGRRWRYALRLLATVRAGDEHLVAGGPALFSTLAGLSVVRRERLGLAVREPYRSLFELAYQWRRPKAHTQVRTRAAEYRGARLAERTAGPEERAGLVEQGLFLSGDPLLRSTLFPPAEDGSRIGPARQEEAQDIERLMHPWAVRGGFDVALRGWLRSAVRDLADAEDRADAEAGAILQAYYLGRDRTHHQVAWRLHLSRATYFRRLRRGPALVAARLPGSGAGTARWLRRRGSWRWGS